MKVLIVDSGDGCLGKEAAGILKLFDPYMIIYRTRLEQTVTNDNDAEEMLPEDCLAERWDYLIFMGSELSVLPSELVDRSKGWTQINMEDLQLSGSDVSFSAYDNLKEHLYWLYCEEIRFSGGLTCTCGANVFCKCE